MRKQILKSNPATSAPLPGELDVAALAIVAVTSEAADHPIENAFDCRRGPGGSRWIAETPGEQTLVDLPEIVAERKDLRLSGLGVDWPRTTAPSGQSLDLNHPCRRTSTCEESVLFTG